MSVEQKLYRRPFMVESWSQSPNGMGDPNHEYGFRTLEEATDRLAELEDAGWCGMVFERNERNDWDEH